MPTIRVLVAYTPRVSGAVADVPGLIEVAIAETNRSYDNSAINARLQLVHSYQVSYTESGSFDTDLSYFRGNGDGRMDEVHTRRRQYCADVCVLLIDNSSYCGLASTIMADAATAFAAVHYDCATGYYSFGHEIGHLMGARHNPEADPTNTPYAYGHGYLHGPQFRTVMAYNCPGGCPRRDHWSNPGVSLMGFSTGTANHDNARVLNATAPVVANFVSLISCLRIDWGRLRHLTELCRAVGCNAVLRAGEDVANPSPEYLRAVKAGGPNAQKLQALRKNALQLILRAEQASPTEQAQIEKQAQSLNEQVQKLLALRTIR
ncbi:MAG: hypothetical protein HXY24_15090 [Rubrivivax sp.]|nr:hypothetical protein [Rubrivivax sp.]